MPIELILVLGLVLYAEFVNGWTDAPNAIATVVSTRVISPRRAVLMATALNILGASQFGIPLSTTHTITTSIMGVGAARRVSAVRWGVSRDIVFAWILTFPACGAIAFLSALILKQVF